MRVPIHKWKKNNIILHFHYFEFPHVHVITFKETIRSQIYNMAPIKYSSNMNETINQTEVALTCFTWIIKSNQTETYRLKAKHNLQYVFTVNYCQNTAEKITI